MPKEIDPEVQALLDENPATLPPELIKEGWGHFKMRDFGSLADTTRTPSKVQAPTYDEICVQCQRPIAKGHRGWMDHRGSSHCPADMLDEERVAEHHIPQADYDLLTSMRDAQIEWNKQRVDLLNKSKAASKKAKQDAANVVHGPQQKCSAQKHHTHHSHQCFHPAGHFGFHECRECRHLWG